MCHLLSLPTRSVKGSGAKSQQRIRAPRKSCSSVLVAIERSESTEKGLVGASCERQNTTRLAKVTVNALGDTGPHLVEVIVENNDAPGCECFHSYRQVVSSVFSCMAAIDTDKPLRASRESFQRRPMELATIRLLRALLFRRLWCWWLVSD